MLEIDFDRGFNHFISYASICFCRIQCKHSCSVCSGEIAFYPYVILQKCSATFYNTNDYIHPPAHIHWRISARVRLHLSTKTMICKTDAKHLILLSSVCDYTFTAAKQTFAKDEMVCRVPVPKRPSWDSKHIHGSNLMKFYGSKAWAATSFSLLMS